MIKTAIKSKIYISKSCTPSANLAMEEFLLNKIGTGENYLFLYRNDDCVVIGRNQNPWLECNLSYLIEQQIPLFRRLSGGGAVFHDRGNLNYAFISTRDSYCVEDQFQIILTALERTGAKAVLADHHAITINALKVSGNAFTVKKAGAIHHGTILVTSNLNHLELCLAPSKNEILTKAVRSRTANVTNVSEISQGATPEILMDKLVEVYSESAAHSPEIIEVDVDRMAIDELRPLVERHCSFNWSYGETPSFDVRLTEETWNLTLTVEKARITHVTLSFNDGSSLDNSEAEALRASLIGLRFDRNKVLEAASKFLNRLMRQNL